MKNSHVSSPPLAMSLSLTVSESFTASRHPSTILPSSFPPPAGLLVLKEIDSLRRATDNPERPYAVVLGGSKVSDKLGVIANLLTKADMLFIGGGMAYTFLAAKGYSVGKSLLEEDQIETVKGYIAEAAERGVDLVLPVDTLVAPEFAADAPATVVAVDAIPADQMGLDIGPESQKLFADKLSTAKTVAWNGPMGVFEFDTFSGGTRAVAEGTLLGRRLLGHRWWRLCCCCPSPRLR